MRLYRVVMRSGVNVDIMAKSVVDDPALSPEVRFYYDDGRHHLATSIKRIEIAGLILLPQKSSAMRHY